MLVLTLRLILLYPAKNLDTVNKTGKYQILRLEKEFSTFRKLVSSKISVKHFNKTIIKIGRRTTVDHT